jgi:hypothetical protein
MSVARPIGVQAAPRNDAPMHCHQAQPFMQLFNGALPRATPRHKYF